MSPPLLDQLARYGDHLDDVIDAHPHTTPPADHGPATSARRRRGLLAAVSVSVLIAAIVAVGLAGSSERAQAWTGWSATVQAADLDDLAALDAACGRDDAPPLVAVDVRGDGGAALYADDQRWVLCQAARTSAGTFEPTTRLVQHGDDLAIARAVADDDQPIVTVALGWHGDPAASFAWGVRDRSLSAVELITAATTIEAGLHDDLWLAWWPDDTTHEADAVGRDAAGEVVVEAPVGSLSAPAPDPDSLAAQIATDGTALEREVLADGVVTWAEMQAGLDAWTDCVADAGHELTIEIDHDTRTYLAISPTVAVGIVKLNSGNVTLALQ